VRQVWRSPCDDKTPTVGADAASVHRTIRIDEEAVRMAMRPLRPEAAGLLDLPVFGGSGVVPGVDLDDARALDDMMDEGTPLDAMR